MTMHENEGDLSNQERVMKIIHGWLQRLPAVGNNGEGFRYEGIPTLPNESTPDFKLHWNHLWVGVIEVKCRFDMYPSWMIGRDKLVMLYDKYMKMGKPAMLANAYMIDGEIKQVWFEDVRNLLPKEQWEKTTMVTTNHGTQQRSEPQPAYNIPADLFRTLL